MAQSIEPETLDLKDQVVNINRVTKVVKGGKNFSFAALVVVGDGNTLDKTEFTAGSCNWTGERTWGCPIVAWRPPSTASPSP